MAGNDEVSRLVTRGHVVEFAAVDEREAGKFVDVRVRYEGDAPDWLVRAMYVGEPVEIVPASQTPQGTADSDVHPAPSGERERPPVQIRAILGCAFRDARVERGISLRQAASAMGVTTVRLGEIERGFALRSEEPGE